MSTNKTVSISFPWVTVLTVILAIAKVTGHLAISWWIVFLPMLLPIAGLAIFFIIVALLTIIGVIFAAFAS